MLYLFLFKKLQIEQIKNRLVAASYRAIFKDNSYYKRINIDGNNRTSHDEIAAIVTEELIDNQGDDGNYQLAIESLKKKIEALPWVDEVVINRNLQDSLNIHIKEHEPFAIWQDNDKKYIVSKAGKIIAVKDIEQFNNLIILTGNGAYQNVKSLFNILVIDPEISKNIYSATWVGGRRWDVRFENNLLVKLPAGDISDAWTRLIKIYNMPGSLIGLKTIDLRIAKKIYLEYDDQTTKELKSQKN